MSGVPTGLAFQRALGDLFDRKVEAKAAKPQPPPARAAMGVYVFDDGAVGAVCACDLSFAASAGAALSLVPVATANAALKGGSLPEVLSENFSEVLNVLSSLIAAASNRRVRLREVVLPGAPVPADAQPVLARGRERVDLDVTIAGYPGGKVALIAAA